MNKVIISTILAAVLMGVIGLQQNVNAFDPSTGAHITVLNSHGVVTYSGFVVSHFGY
jgi:hypothetical protein